MKVKQTPNDFQVEELTDTLPGPTGPFAFYRLEKRSWNTVDAVQAICRRWRLDWRAVAIGGLKDRHAATTQFLTIEGGPKRGLHHQELILSYLGQLPEPYSSKLLRGNRFRLTLRDLTRSAVTAAEYALDEVRRDGVPNYFDDQRFGSVTPGGEFIAKTIVLGEYEKALRLALAAPNEHDRAGTKREKVILRANWGSWAACLQRLPRGHARDLVEYLARNPEDYRGALERLRPELRGLYLSAYQSHLWNQQLTGWLRTHLKPDQHRSVELRAGTVIFPRNLTDEQRSQLSELTLPLPSARAIPSEDDPRRPLFDAVLAAEGIDVERLKLNQFRHLFFSKGERAALYHPVGLTAESQADDLHDNRVKLSLSFELPRGCYATLLVKRITPQQR